MGKSVLFFFIHGVEGKSLSQCTLKAIFQLRFEYDSSVIRARFDYEAYEMPTIRLRYNIRGAYEELCAFDHVIWTCQFFCVAVRCCSQSARRRRRFCDDVIVTYNFSVYFSAHFRRFVSIYTVFIMNNPIKNLSGQDIENLIELYRLERCFILIVGQLRCRLSMPISARPAAYCYRAGSRRNIW